MEREAFGRAWRFLSYKSGAKWTALTAAVATAILYVALLLILSLFTELIVSRGRIPSYRELSRQDRSLFESTWTGAPENVRKQRLEDIGIEERTATQLENADPDRSPSLEQELLWRAHIYRILADRIGPRAAALVLPDYHDLPPRAQDAFLQAWRQLPVSGRKERLAVVGDKAADLTIADPAKLSRDDRELLWRAHFYFLQDQVNPRAAEAFWRDRILANGENGVVEEAPQRALADRGILSLIVRIHTRPVQVGLGWLASLCPWLWHAGNGMYLICLLGLAVILVLLRALAMFVMNYMAALATIEASTRLSRAVYHHTFRLGRLAFRELGPGEAVSIITDQVVAVRDALYTWITVVAREPVKFGLLLAFALVLHVWLALAFLLFALLVWLLGGQVAAYFRIQERAARNEAVEQIALLRESLMLMRLVKCYLMELFNQNRVERQLSMYAAAQLRHHRGEAIYRPLLILLGNLAAIVLLYVAGLIVLSGQMGIARAIILATVLVSLYWPLVNWLEHRRVIRAGRKAAAILFKFLDRPGEVGQVVGAEFLPPLSKQLVFDHVTFQEPGTGRKLLEDVTLAIPAGQRVALVGPDEMEKHAFVYLIPRFLDPNAGEIRIDKHNIRWVTFDSLRAQIAIVLQHSLLFNDTVAHNIGCGDPSYDLPKIIDAAKVAHAHQFIQKLPKGYETPIGDMGHTLALGEKFRIALARAILRDPALLIIEEPVTVLDDDTKGLLEDTFTRVLPGRTVIFLPHRISTIRMCDRIYLLHKGRIEAAGDHRELLTQSELYRHLQYLEFNAFADQV